MEHSRDACSVRDQLDYLTLVSLSASVAVKVSSLFVVLVFPSPFLEVDPFLTDRSLQRM